jgi:hypothetical protein
LVSKVLLPLGRAEAAEDELRWKVVPALHEAARNIDLAYAYSLLSSIRLGEGDAAGNLAYERNRWEALFPFSWQVPEIFVLSSFDLMIAAGLNRLDGRDYLLSMFREWSSNVSMDIEHFPEIKAELEK